MQGRGETRPAWPPVVSARALDLREPQRPACVYAQILGPAWSELPASIRATYAAGQMRGFMQVSWGAGLLARGLAWTLGLPRPCPRLEVVLEVQPVVGGDRWVRRMGSAILASTQRASNGLLLESFGLFVWALRLFPHALGLRYVQEYAALQLGPWQPRLPRWAAPRVVAQVSETPAGALTEVEISVPLVGRVLRYEGIMEPSLSDRRP